MLIDATFNLATFFYHTSTLASSVSASSPVAAVAAVAVAGRPTCGDQGIKAAPATAPPHPPQGQPVVGTAANIPNFVAQDPVVPVVPVVPEVPEVQSQAPTLAGEKLYDAVWLMVQEL